MLIDLQGLADAAPAWLASAVTHLLLLLVAMLLAFGSGGDLPLGLTVSVDDSGYESAEAPLDLSSDVDLAVDEPLLSNEAFETVETPVLAPTLTPVAPTGAATAMTTPALDLGTALDGRRAGTRDTLLKMFGGTAETEDAVVEALKWLSRRQQSDGSWSLRGPYTDGAPGENREAATAMALLAFQGHGHLPGMDDDPFSKNVARGWRWLLGQQDDEGCFFRQGRSNHRFYTHAQATIALCELYALTRSSELRDPARRAIRYLVESQTEQGGWRYEPRIDNDLSVTGWVLMALKSGRMGGLETPSPVFDGASKFLDSVAREDPRKYAEVGSRYVYESVDLFNSEEVPAMTAEGLLCRQYLGWPRDEPRLKQGVDFLMENLPDWRRGRKNVYYWYYATQVLRHFGGEPWREWNDLMRVQLPAHQVKRGPERGSWDPDGDLWGTLGGRLFETCLSAYVLEVYYRHLPIYGDGAINSAR